MSAPLFKASLTPGDLGQLDFIQGLLEGAIKDSLVEPARMAISLDADMRVEQVRAAELLLVLVLGQSQPYSFPHCKQAAAFCCNDVLFPAAPAAAPVGSTCSTSHHLCLVVHA